MSVSLIDGHVDDDTNRMTDNEIIKVLECCSNAEPCENCPYQKQCDETDLAEIALNLINRQKAEIEMLQNDLSTWKDIAHRETSYVSIAKAEAVNEFAERLKNAVNPISIGENYKIAVINWNGIDNLVKEMVGENNAD